MKTIGFKLTFCHTYKKQGGWGPVTVNRSLLPAVIPRMIPAMVAVGLLAAILLAGHRQSKRIHFVVSGSLDISVTRSPIEGAVHNRRPIDHRAPAGEVPEDISGCCVQRVHLS